MKEGQKRNKYLHKKLARNEDSTDDFNVKIGSDGSETKFGDSEGFKWYNELPEEPDSVPEIKESELMVIKGEAEMLLKKEEDFYMKKSGRGGQQDKAWLRTVMAKGTASDRVAAAVVTIQDNPVYNLPSLRNLVNTVKVSKKKECLMVMDTLTELFLSDLLLPSRRLRWFAQQPVALLTELSSGNAVTRRKLLCAWLFEDRLKTLYAQFVTALDAVGKDTVDAHREKSVTTLYKLLAGNPEQETVLLKNIVNKLGDPNQKVVSKVIYSLTQLLRSHPGMKQVVASEIEQFLFRQNVGSRAQYYAVCFLSQYLFTSEDARLAENIISIYFSFFKATVKKGDIDSRMMAALLMGVNRAYPFAWLEQNELREHIDTLFKLVHVCSFNISLQTLCLLYQIVGHSADRFFCALYKKLLDPHLASSAHQAMFMNLVYKSLKNDTNLDRVRVFIKRLLQVCLNCPSQLSCALLYLVSELISKRPALLATRTHRQNVIKEEIEEDDEEEVYKDAPLPEEDKQLIEKHAEKEDVEVKEIKGGPGWVHCKTHSDGKVKSDAYDGRLRNPAHAGGEWAAYEELTALSAHYHPTVALFAKTILDRQPISYTGDPLQDFTLVRFLERFVFKNPKQHVSVDERDRRGPDPCLAQRKRYLPSGQKAVSITSANFTQQGEKSVPVDELFLYRYLHQTRSKVKDEVVKEEDEESDNESVGSEEFNEMLDNMVGNADDDLDFADEIGDKLKSSKKKTKRQQQEAESDSEEEFSEEEGEDEEADVDEDEELTDLEDEEEGSDAEAIDFDDDGDDFDEEIDMDNLESGDEEDFEEEGRKKSKLGQPKSKGIHSMFAPAEKFAEMLEEAGASRTKLGTAQDVSNRDNAAIKQLEWESKRNNNWSKGSKRKHFGKGPGKNFTKSKRIKH